jgi:conjugal transfer pilin signal peptidase TrbI
MSTLNEEIENEPLTLKLFIDRSKSFGPILLTHIKRYAITYALMAMLYGVVHANYRISYNETPSLPYTWFLVCLNETVDTGGFIAFRWHGGEPYPDGITFVKRLVASPGEIITRNGRNFTVGERTLIGKAVGLSMRKLYPNEELHDGKNTIQLGKYFVAGDHEYSLDSRYNLLGLVDKKEVIGRAYPIF